MQTYEFGKIELRWQEVPDGQRVMLDGSHTTTCLSLSHFFSHETDL